jgi:hypothetical protein
MQNAAKGIVASTERSAVKRIARPERNAME